MHFREVLPRARNNVSTKGNEARWNEKKEKREEKSTKKYTSRRDGGSCRSADIH